MTTYLIPSAGLDVTPIGITSVAAASLPIGAPPTVTNTGSSTAAKLVFGIPAGAPGAPGPAGAAGAGQIDRVATLGALANYSGPLGCVSVDGYLNSGDGGGGTFIWEPGSVAAPNNGTIIAAKSKGGGNWVRIYEQLNAKYFGALGGTSSFNMTALGITTLAALEAAYGSWVGSYPYGVLFNLAVHAAAPSGVTSLTFGLTGLTPANTEASGSFQLYFGNGVGGNVSGITQGDFVTCTVPGVITAGTQVDYVNPSTGEVTLSTPLSAAYSSGTFSFIPSWLSNVVSGMQVLGPGIANGTTVSGTPNMTTGVVTLSTATSAPMVAMTSNLSSTQYYQGTQITFYAPYTDAQAAALTSDAMGINAALQSIWTNGGTVYLSPGTYHINMPLITNVWPDTNHSMSIVGSGQGQGGPTTIIVTQDLGPSNYAISCGDPTGTKANQRGIYQNSGGGWFSSGVFRDFSITTYNNAGGAFPGFRPTYGGRPIAMGGIKAGPRKNLERFDVNYFNVGIQFQGDWTKWNYVGSANNFIGFRLDDPMNNLEWDLNFENCFFGGNGWAGISISPNAQILGILKKCWIADQPYGIWLEPGGYAAGNGQAGVINTQFIGCNCEGCGNGFVIDGNTMTSAQAVKVGVGSYGQARGIINVTIDLAGGQIACNSLYARRSSSGTPIQMNAFFDLLQISARIVNLGNEGTFLAGTSFPTGIQGVVRTNEINVGTITCGGLFISGAGVGAVVATYGANLTELLTGAANYQGYTGVNSGLYAGGSYMMFEMEIPGFCRATQYLLAPPTTATLTQGTLMEYVSASGSYFNCAAAVPSGTAGAAQAGQSAAQLGVILESYGGSMANKFVTIAFNGRNLPVKVTSAVANGTLLKPDILNPGQAVADTTSGYNTPSLLTVAAASGSGASQNGIIFAKLPYNL